MRLFYLPFLLKRGLRKRCLASAWAETRRRGGNSSFSAGEESGEDDSDDGAAGTVSFDAEAKNEDGETVTLVHVEADADAFPEGTTPEAEIPLGASLRVEEILSKNKARRPSGKDPAGAQRRRSDGSCRGGWDLCRARGGGTAVLRDPLPDGGS